MQMHTCMHACTCSHAVDYSQGYNITMGAGCYMNFNCCILDCAPVKIGKNVRMHALQLSSSQCSSLALFAASHFPCFTPDPGCDT